MKNIISLAQYVATFVSAVLNNIFLSPRVIGKENLNELIKLKAESGLGVVFISNHINAADPFVETATFSTVVKKEIFPITFLAAHDKFGGMLKSFGMKILGCIPVEQGKISSLREVIKLIKGGQSVYLFPEGMVSPNGQMGPDHGALEFFAKFTDVIVQPIYITGLKPFWDLWGMLSFQRSFKVVFGIPFVLKRGSEIDAMSTIASLKGRRYKTVHRNRYNRRA